MRWRIPILALCLMCSVYPGRAQGLVLELDPARTRINFALGATLHTVDGHFKLKTGRVNIDRASGAAEGELIIDAASAGTGNTGRDRKMHSEILESSRYPEIVFIPSHVAGSIPAQGDFDVQVLGVCRLHGSEHELSLAVHVRRSGAAVDFTTQFSVPYVNWGLKNPSTLLLHVAPDVQVFVTAAGHVSEQG